jgi:hypothetical protein
MYSVTSSINVYDLMCCNSLNITRNKLKVLAVKYSVVSGGKQVEDEPADRSQIAEIL